jgi:hypothetical protein
LLAHWNAVILLSQWYTAGSPGRTEELLRVRDANEGGGLFERCVYVDGDARRWTYGDFLDLASESFPGEVVAVANTDIEFDETIGLAAKACTPNRVLALTRWETPASPRMMGHATADGRFFSGSQDTWMFIAGRLANPPRLREVPLGVVACDQVSVAEWTRAGVEVFNPAIDVRTWHIHRDPPPEDREQVFGVYAYPELTTLIGTGLVVWHHWPSEDGRITLEATQTWRA